MYTLEVGVYNENHDVPINSALSPCQVRSVLPTTPLHPSLYSVRSGRTWDVEIPSVAGMLPPPFPLGFHEHVKAVSEVVRQPCGRTDRRMTFHQ